MRRYYNEEPWGPWRDNVHAAQICALLANIHRKKGAATVTYEDFMLIDPRIRQQRRRSGVISFFRAMAKRGRDGNA
jgi:hypothetical protein